MDAPSPSPVPPWHRRVLDWLAMEWAEAGKPPPSPDERFVWEPTPPAPRPPQWGAANRPELLLGLDDAAPIDATAPRAPAAP